MSELLPLLHEGADELEAALLRSGQDDAPPDDAARARTLEAVKLASQAAVAVGVGVLVWRWLTASAAGQWFVIGAMVSGTLVASAEIVSVPEAKRPFVAPTSTSTSTSTATSTSTSTATATSTPTSTSTSTATPTPSGTLRDETVMLESVREYLADSQAKQALATLDDYDARFPTGWMTEDAAFLRIEALVAAGKRGEARRLGEGFPRKYPGSTWGAEVRKLLERNP